MSDLADFVEDLTRHGLSSKAVRIAVAAFERIEVRRREKHRDCMRRVRSRDVTREVTEPVMSRDITQRKEEEEVQVFSESYFLSDDKTFSVSPEEFAAWEAMFPSLKPERIQARWRALYKSWLCTLDPDQRKRAFENKIAKDIRDAAEKASKVVPLVKPGEEPPIGSPERLEWWRQRTRGRG